MAISANFSRRKKQQAQKLMSKVSLLKKLDQDLDSKDVVLLILHRSNQMNQAGFTDSDHFPASFGTHQEIGHDWCMNVTIGKTTRRGRVLRTCYITLN